jgi:hypothetical protein
MNSHPGTKRILGAACVALLALAFALSSAISSDAKKGRPTLHGPTHGAAGGWQVLPPITYKNLTLFPIRATRGAAAETRNDYITLDEGIRNGTVVITERGSTSGGGQMAQRGGRGRSGGRLQGMVNQLTSGGSDSVNQLALINRSGKKLLLLAGEVITGGKQDRIVEEDLIIPPVSVPVSLNVFCVEPGRWQNRSAGSGGGGGAANGPARQEAAIDAAPLAPKASDGFSSLGAISHPKLRAAAQDKKDQNSVWGEVRANNAKLGTKTETETYKEVYDKREVGDQMQHYVAAFEREVTGPGIVGVVVARGGQLVWVDCFVSDSLFAKYWPKLLKSYVIDALGEEMSEKRPSVEQAQAYLRLRPQMKTAVIGQPGIYSLSKIADAQTAVFELRDISLAAPLLLHFNKMER